MTKINVLLLLLSLSLVTSIGWAEQVDLDREAVEASGARLKPNGELKIYGFTLQSRNARNFSSGDPEDDKAGKEHPEWLAEDRVVLSASPDGQWVVITLTDFDYSRDYWLYNQGQKAKPIRLPVETEGRHANIFWISNSVFRVWNGTSFMPEENQLFQVEKPKLPLATIGEFVAYYPEKGLCVSVYQDGLEICRAFGGQRPNRFFIKKGFLRNYLGSGPTAPDDLSLLPNKEPNLKTQIEGKKLVVDYQTEEGKKVRKEFLLKL